MIGPRLLLVMVVAGAALAAPALAGSREITCPEMPPNQDRGRESAAGIRLGLAVASADMQRSRGNSTNDVLIRTEGYHDAYLDELQLHYRCLSIRERFKGNLDLQTSAMDRAIEDLRARHDARLAYREAAADKRLATREAAAAVHKAGQTGGRIKPTNIASRKSDAPDFTLSEEGKLILASATVGGRRPVTGR